MNKITDIGNAKELGTVKNVIDCYNLLKDSSNDLDALKQTVDIWKEAIEKIS